MFEFSIIFAIGLLSGFLGSFTSGGLAMIALPSLIAFGLSPHVALGTLWFGVLGFDVGGLHQYIKNKKVVWNKVPALAIIAVIGGSIGSLIVLQLDASFVSKIIGVVLLLLIPIILFMPSLGVDIKQVNKVSERLGYISIFFISIYGKSIGIAYGLFAVLSGTYFFGWSLLQSKATGKIPSLLSSCVALYIFGINDSVHWQYGCILMVGMFLGSSIGTKYSILLGDKRLRYILLGSIFILSVKLILDL